ncbi:MAG: DNA translocase FtsK [Paracoccaceae bacterium]|nr:DNA translocase FtsK [Paracoccaceae bacterium]
MAMTTRPRDPLFDADTQEVIERRGRELVGMALLALGLAAAALIWSYAPDDPSWLSVTDEPAANWLGRVGAAIASPLHFIIGLGSWAIPAILLVWGLRFLFHQGSERWAGRLIFAPIVVAVASAYCSTLVPVAGWTHSFSMGGLFGDTVLGAILGVVPVSAGTGLKAMAVVLFAGLFVLGAFVAGFTREELFAYGRYLLRSSIMVYAVLLALVWRALRGVGRGMAMLWARAPDREVDHALPEAEPLPLSRPRKLRAEPPVSGEAETTEGGLLAKLPGLLKIKAPEPETDAPEADPENDERIKARIADVIRARVRQPMVHNARSEPPVERHPKGPQPMILAGASRFAPVDDDIPDAMPEPELVEGVVPPAPAFGSSRIATPEPKAVVQHPKPRTQVSQRAKAEAQPEFAFDETQQEFELPPLGLLSDPGGIERHHLSDAALEENARMLEAVLDDYGVKGEIVSVRPGPVVTMYELEPAPGLKASRVIGLADDIARSMSALSARVSTVPGRSVIGIELPNEKREKVVLREILSARDYGDGHHRLPLALGKDIGGEPVIANLAKMPHLLIAGTTGSGKSVAINTMIMSLLYKLTPDECRLIMIDPKMLELSVYDGIPHLLSPVVTDPKKAVVALKWVVAEMEERYRKMSKMGVRNIEGYNGRVAEALKKGEMFSRTVQTGFDNDTGEPIFESEEFAPEALPYIVVIVDEMADLMMVAGKEIEACIQRLAQMARASGIHLIMATQRPSVDVITGTIKANFPTRISFQVTGKIDSRTILGEQGAEQLLGMGDMLYMAGGAKITRVHGPFVSDEEVEEIVNYLKAYGPPDYVGSVVEGPDEGTESDIDAVLGLNTGGNTDGEDALYDQAVQIVITDRKCSTSYIQRKLAIGYNKAARLVEQMEENGLVTPANHVGKREILVPEPG